MVTKGNWPLHQASPMGTQRHADAPETAGSPRHNHDRHLPLGPAAEHRKSTERPPGPPLLGDASPILAWVHENGLPWSAVQQGVGLQRVRH